MSRKHDAVMVDVTMERDTINAILNALALFEIADDENAITRHAKHLKWKILKYGRAYNNKGKAQSTVNFYLQETATLIKLLGFYINATSNITEDLYSQIGKTE